MEPIMDDHTAMTRYAESELSLLPENAAEAGLEWSEPDVRRVESGGVSALEWGDPTRPALLFLHGGSQNAHTWDTVLLALLAREKNLSAVAVDLPGHGRSAWRDDHDYTPITNADTVARFLDAQYGEEEFDAVIGMSLGGLTAIALDGRVSTARRVLVDVTPSTPGRVAELTGAQRESVALASGPRTFDSFDDVLAATVAASPTRSRSSLRRGILHNALRRDDGTWQWRYDSFRSADGATGTIPDMDADALWAIAEASVVPTLVVRGGNSMFTTAEDVERYTSIAPDARATVIDGAGHSVQGDRPLELAAALADFILQR